jgi:hypothetical protein
VVAAVVHLALWQEPEETEVLAAVEEAEEHRQPAALEIHLLFPHHKETTVVRAEHLPIQEEVVVALVQ